MLHFECRRRGVPVAMLVFVFEVVEPFRLVAVGDRGVEFYPDPAHVHDTWGDIEVEGDDGLPSANRVAVGCMARDPRRADDVDELVAALGGADLAVLVFLCLQSHASLLGDHAGVVAASVERSPGDVGGHGYVLSFSTAQGPVGWT